MHQQFIEFDVDGSGAIDINELAAIFEALGEPTKRAALEELIDVVDDDGSGEIEFPEFVEVRALGWVRCRALSDQASRN